MITLHYNYRLIFNCRSWKFIWKLILHIACNLFIKWFTILLLYTFRL